MESASLLSSTEDTFHISQESQYVKYVSLNPSELVASNEKSARFYTVAARVATIAATILIIAVVAGATAGILLIPGVNITVAAVIAGALLLVGYAFYQKCINEGLIPVSGSDQKYGICYLKDRAKEHQKIADTEKKIMERAQGMLQDKPSQDPGIANLKARIFHWNDVTKEKEKELVELNREIILTKEAIRSALEKGEDSTADEKKLSGQLRDQYTLEAVELSTAKIQAAYTYHIFMNPSEIRSLGEILNPIPRSYAMRADLKQVGLEPPLFLMADQKRPIYINDILSTDIIPLSHALFASQITAD